jgi:hypothetical protein
MNNLEFGGYPVKHRKVDNTVLVNCKNVTGTLDQLLDFMSTPYESHHFGIRTKKVAEINHNPLSNEVIIGCIKEDFNQLKSKLSWLKKQYQRKTS